MHRLIQPLCQLRGIQAAIKEVVDVRGLVGSCQEVIDPPKADGVFLVALRENLAAAMEMLIAVVGLGHHAYLRVCHEQGWQHLLLFSGQVLVQPAFAYELGKLVGRKMAVLQGFHAEEVLRHAVMLEQLQG